MARAIMALILASTTAFAQGWTVKLESGLTGAVVLDFGASKLTPKKEAVRVHSKWKVIAQPKAGGPPRTFVPSEVILTTRYPRDQRVVLRMPGFVELEYSSILVAFTDDGKVQNAVFPPPPSLSPLLDIFWIFSGTTDKKDASVFLSALWIPAVGSPPLFILDGFGDVSLVKKEWIGVQGAIKQDRRKRVDPDSITGGMYLQKPLDWKYGWLREVRLRWDAAGAEYARRGGTTNFLTAPSMRFAFDMPRDIGFFAATGIEFPRNTENAVQDEPYGWRARGVLVTKLQRIFEKPKLVIIHPKRISLYHEFQGRWLARDEMFVTVVRAQGKDNDVLGLSRKPRSYNAVEMNLGLTDFFGVNAKYEYGSLPPSFAFVNHKVTITLTFGLKLR